MDTDPQFNLFLNLLFLVFLTMTNAFFACTEIAMVSINKNKINLLAENGNKTAKLIQKVLEEPTNFLSTIQVAITLSGFFASASAATGFAEVLSKRLVIFNLPYTKEISIIIVTIILSYFTLVFGELVPKRIALHKAEAISMFAIRPIYVIAKITFPFIKLLSFSTNTILRLLGFKIDNIEEQVSEEEIKSLLEVGQLHGVFNKTEKDMITSVLSFDNKSAKEIMTPRIDTYMIDINAPLDEYLDELLNKKYSRVPVFDKEIDNIVGILFIKDFILEARKKGFDNVDIRSIIREPYFIPKTKKIDVLFKEMQTSKIFMAIIIDEYGGFSGIVTMEDLIEEIVGSIEEDYEDKEPKMTLLEENTYLVDGLFSLDTLNYELGLNLHSDNYDTLSGFIIGELEKIPNEEENIILEYNNVTLEVLKVKDKRITQVKLILSHKELDTETTEESISDF
ncbi:Putative Mg2+ and Co2+ transporter CorB [Fusobacterium necrogenes]|uniref:Mg2+ and Co2+ transporter CorB n=1 Tax=Fusobacterium necrogenes TaxID=858 RepID=A0A377GX83_9FUSO|nr:hemolysin family protein [Fusobacterium necrogenes]STO31161.1 Putative Mg2+ and Co2+ transporter CorB [Fusobacterium necrogenes]